ncbi:MAG: hypothetical protein WB562_13720, partial [Candidatus Sulfotelmatobacter sp.]
MTEAAHTPVRRRWWKYLLFIFAGVVLVGLSMLWYINTDSFQGMVRRRLTAEVERITGGRAEIGSFHTIPFRMQIDVRDITIHGRESASEIPLAHAEGLIARMKVSSLLRSELGFREVILERPVIHVAVYPDGTTNIPAPKVPGISGNTVIAKLFTLSINRLEVRHGEMLWSDQSLPLDFSVRNTELQMDYSFLRGRYLSRLLLGKVDTKFDDCRPFAWMSTVEFSLASSFVDITSLKWNSGRSHLEARGRISDFHHPHVEASYEAHVDLTEAAAIARRRDLQGGLLELKGQGNWSVERFTANGQAAFRDLAWRGDPRSFSKGSLVSDYSVNEDQIKLSKLQGRLFGGSFTGDAEFNHWLSPAQHVAQGQSSSTENMAIITAARPQGKSDKNAKKAGKPEIQSGFVLLRVRDFSAGELAAGLIAPVHPLEGFHPAGSVSGTVEARWRGSPGDAEMAFALSAKPPAVPVRGGLPVTAVAKGTYKMKSDSLDLPQFTFSTPASHIQSSGVLAAKSALHLAVATSSLGEWRPLVAFLRGSVTLPLTLNGSATFNGDVTGAFSSPVFSGALLVNDFELTLPATRHTPEQRVHWDSLSTTLHLSAYNIAFHNSILRRENTAAEFDVSAYMQDWHYNDDGPFTLSASFHNADVAALQSLAGLDYPVTGKVDLSLQASGMRSDPRGEGQVRLTDA